MDTFVFLDIIRNHGQASSSGLRGDHHIIAADNRTFLLKFSADFSVLPAIAFARGDYGHGAAIIKNTTRRSI